MDSALESNIPAGQSQKGPSGVGGKNTPRKRRTSEGFYLFCKFVLDHEKLNSGESLECTGKLEDKDIVKKSSILEPPKTTNLASTITEDSQDSDYEPEAKKASTEANKESSSSTENGNVDAYDEDSYNLVTCFCEKPFAGRPMIECSVCLTWVHLSCAKVKKSHIPEVYFCPSCKEKKHS